MVAEKCVFRRAFGSGANLIDLRLHFYYNSIMEILVLILILVLFVAVRLYLKSKSVVTEDIHDTEIRELDEIEKEYLESQVETVDWTTTDQIKEKR